MRRILLTGSAFGPAVCSALTVPARQMLSSRSASAMSTAVPASLLDKLVAGIQQDLLEARAEIKELRAAKEAVGAAKDAELKEERAAAEAELQKARAAANAVLKEELQKARAAAEAALKEERAAKDAARAAANAVLKEERAAAESELQKARAAANAVLKEERAAKDAELLKARSAAEAVLKEERAAKDAVRVAANAVLKEERASAEAELKEERAAREHASHRYRSELNDHMLWRFFLDAAHNTRDVRAVTEHAVNELWLRVPSLGGRLHDGKGVTERLKLLAGLPPLAQYIKDVAVDNNLDPALALERMPELFTFMPLPFHSSSTHDLATMVVAGALLKLTSRNLFLYSGGVSPVRLDLRDVPQPLAECIVSAFACALAK